MKHPKDKQTIDAFSGKTTEEESSMKDLLKHQLPDAMAEQTTYTRSYRQKMRAKGLVKVEIWVPCNARGKLKEYAEKLRNGKTR